MKGTLIPLLATLALPIGVFAGETISNPPDSFVKIYEKHTEEKYPTSNGKVQSGIAFYIDKDSIKEFNNIVSFKFVSFGIDKNNKPIYPNQPFLIYEETGKVDCKNNKLSIFGSEFKFIAFNWTHWKKVKNFVCLGGK